MASRKVKTQFSGLREVYGNIPWDAFVELLEEVRRARQMNEILLPLIAHVLELQYLTTQAHKPALRPRFKPMIDKAAKTARGAVTDLTTRDLNAAKKQLRELEAIVQEIRDSLDA